MYSPRELLKSLVTMSIVAYFIPRGQTETALAKTDADKR